MTAIVQQLCSRCRHEASHQWDALAESYYQKIASAEAKRTGTMSAREFEYFEVGRRYANTEYQADLQNMTGDNLVREQILDHCNALRAV